MCCVAFTFSRPPWHVPPPGRQRGRMKVRLEAKQELDITFIMQAGAWTHPSTNISFFWNNVFLKFRLKPARFQCELQQRSLIVQPSSRGFKDQQVLPPAQRAPASRSCRSVVQLSLLNHACVSQTRHQQGLDQRCGHLCVCVFSPCAACSPIHGVGAGATWLRTGGIVVPPHPSKPPTHRNMKKKAHLWLHPEDMYYLTRVTHVHVQTIKDTHAIISSHIIRCWFLFC